MQHHQNLKQDAPGTVFVKQSMTVSLQMPTLRVENSNQYVNLSLKFLMRQIVSELIDLCFAEQIHTHFQHCLEYVQIEGLPMGFTFNSDSSFLKLLSNLIIVFTYDHSRL